MPSNADQRRQLQAEQEQISQNIKNIKHRILVLSGKGGVGKSSIAANLAVWLSMQGKKVGLLDVDIHGPSVPKLLNLEGRRLQGKGNRIEPILYNDTLKVISIGFLIQDENAALIWRGPMKHNNQSPTAQALNLAFEPLLQSDKQIEADNKEQNEMRIAIPLTDGKLSQHFGHCEQFAIVDVDNDSKSIKSQELVSPPPHEPGSLPRWLAGLHVTLIIAGGMGQRAQQLFAQNQIDVAIGAPADSPGELVSAYIEGALQCGENICDH